jgi:hypothetical protein
MFGVGQTISSVLLFIDQSNGTQTTINQDSAAQILAQNTAELQLKSAGTSVNFAAGDVANYFISTVIESYAVASLPPAPVAGQFACVNDALVPVVGSAVSGGGAAFAAVCYNGSVWKVFVI